MLFPMGRCHKGGRCWKLRERDWLSEFIELGGGVETNEGEYSS